MGPGRSGAPEAEGKEDTGGDRALDHLDHHVARDDPARSPDLDRITIFFGVLWFVCCVALGWLVNR
jgi:hypothetical protein